MAQMTPNDKFFSDRGHVWMSEGLTPIFGFEKNPSPHIALPLGFYHAEARAHFVIEQGTFLSQQDNMLIPANGGIPNTVTYTQKDVDGGVLSDFGVKVAYGDTKTFAANKPLGITYWDYLQSSFTLPNGFQTHLSQMLPTIVTEGVFIVPLVYFSSVPFGNPINLSCNRGSCGVIDSCCKSCGTLTCQSVIVSSLKLINRDCYGWGN
jgi:hypothetical protein